MIQLHSEAEHELRAAAAWYERIGRGLASEFVSAIQSALDDIDESPERWPLWPGIHSQAPIRRYVVRRFPFIVPYVVRDNAIVILAIAHMSRAPGYWRSRSGE